MDLSFQLCHSWLFLIAIFCSDPLVESVPDHCLRPLPRVSMYWGPWTWILKKERPGLKPHLYTGIVQIWGKSPNFSVPPLFHLDNVNNYRLNIIKYMKYWAPKMLAFIWNAFKMKGGKGTWFEYLLCASTSAFLCFLFNLHSSSAMNYYFHFKDDEPGCSSSITQVVRSPLDSKGHPISVTSRYFQLSICHEALISCISCIFFPMYGFLLGV